MTKGKSSLRVLIGSSAVVASVFLVTACSPLYIMQATYEESKILARRQKIDRVIGSDRTDPETKRKLALVIKARQFAISQGLTPGDSFTRYSQVDRDVLAWVLVAARKDSFSLRTWWFPIVGSVPYKGFFSRADADSDGQKLEGQGYETWIRPTDAFSTLGWFNDPVLSTMLKRPDPELVNTVIHESTHSTVWIKGDVQFNESLANFVGLTGAVLFFRDELAHCTDSVNCAQVQSLLEQAQGQRAINFELAAQIESLYRDLDNLYQGSDSTQDKMIKRAQIFSEHIGPVRAKFPAMTSLRTVNNAEIIQLKLYLTGLDKFQSVYDNQGADFARFLDRIKHDHISQRS